MPGDRWRPSGQPQRSPPWPLANRPGCLPEPSEAGSSVAVELNLDPHHRSLLPGLADNLTRPGQEHRDWRSILAGCTLDVMPARHPVHSDPIAGSDRVDEAAHLIGRVLVERRSLLEEGFDRIRQPPGWASSSPLRVTFLAILSPNQELLTVIEAISVGNPGDRDYWCADEFTAGLHLAADGAVRVVD